MLLRVCMCVFSRSASSGSPCHSTQGVPATACKSAEATEIMRPLVFSIIQESEVVGVLDMLLHESVEPVLSLTSTDARPGVFEDDRHQERGER